MAYVEISCAEVKKLARAEMIRIDEVRARRVNAELDRKMVEERKKPLRWWIFKDRARSYTEILEDDQKDWHTEIWWALDMCEDDRKHAGLLLSMATESGAPTMKITEDEWRLLR